MTGTARVAFVVGMVLCAAVAPDAPGQGARRAKPRVLLIGDSVCTYYTPFVKSGVGTRADVRRSGHLADTRYGLEHIGKYLDGDPYDVIHFNWGLHDVKPVKGRKNNVPVEEYEKNLRELVRRMKKTGAKLVFATTTPVGPRAARKDADVVRYNEAALRVMQTEDVPVNDLYALIHPQRDALQLNEGVHFTEKGNRIIGEAVAAKILEALNPPTPKEGDAP